MATVNASRLGLSPLPRTLGSDTSPATDRLETAAQPRQTALDTFEAATSKKRHHHHHSGLKALHIAQSVLGRNIQSLKFHGPIAGLLDKNVSDKDCCANFVSACLEKAHLIKPREHRDAVRDLGKELKHDRRWEAVRSLRHAKPGDVVCFNVPGEGPMSHVEMFVGWRHGQPVFIGSNNVNRDGSQRISEGTVHYPIAEILHYRG
jgi:hypothetical protein